MNLDAILTDLTTVTGHSIKVTRCEHALTNAVYKITGIHQSWALRINNPTASQLGIDRHREQVIIDSIKSQHWSPDVVTQNSDYLFTQWCKGLPFRPKTNNELDMIADLLERIQQTKLSSDCAPIKIDEQIGILIAQTNQLHSELGKAIQHKLAEYRPPNKLVLCHHDWHSGNVFMKGEKPVVLDWEYAALGDSVIELACVCEGFDLTVSQQQYLVDALGVSKERFALAQCLTSAMSMLWYLVRFPENHWSDKQQRWLRQWAEVN